MTDSPVTEPAVDESHVRQVAAELSLQPPQVRAAAALLGEGATVPFIARYRKEATGSLDEVAVAAVRDRLAALAALDGRRRSVLDSLAERELLTPALQAAVAGAPTLAALEDVYLPFRPKRRTRALAARERGLEPLATLLFGQRPGVDPLAAAAGYVTPPGADVPQELQVPEAEAALQGARDVIAEWVAEDAGARAALRRLFWQRGTLRSEVVPGQAEGGARFRDYFDWSEPVARAPSHRVLAVLRGAAEGVLTCSIRPPEADALALLEARFVRGAGPAPEQVRLAVRDGYRRLLAPAMENEVRAEAKRRADETAIAVFSRNLRGLLLAPPLGQKRVLAIDPGFRTGCKTVVLDAQGRLLHHEVLFPTGSPQQTRDAAAALARLVRDFRVEAIAVGDGTAGRETEAFVSAQPLPDGVPVVLVDESGASVYSASDVARQELPDQDITVRGAVSIGRRLMDPLAELVKIDPRSIGVGQYQHDVDADRLQQALDDVVASCVNSVGVELNTASPQLLAHVAGLSAATAGRIVAFRGANGPFPDRRSLLRVPRLGAKTFQQAAGFLRVRGAGNPLDASAVHPESYPLVDRMAADLGVAVGDLLRDGALRARIDPWAYAGPTVGLPTLTDILAELARPGRDPRQAFEPFRFGEGVARIEDLRPGMRLPGIVTNVTAFGAFVDVGVHQDGLVHISQLADRYVADPSQVVGVRQRVEVTVLAVDLPRKRISLSMRRDARAAPAPGGA